MTNKGSIKLQLGYPQTVGIFDKPKKKKKKQEETKARERIHSDSQHTITTN